MLERKILISREITLKVRAKFAEGDPNKDDSLWEFIILGQPLFFSLKTIKENPGLFGIEDKYAVHKREAPLSLLRDFHNRKVEFVNWCRENEFLSTAEAMEKL